MELEPLFRSAQQFFKTPEHLTHLILSEVLWFEYTAFASGTEENLRKRFQSPDELQVVLRRYQPWIRELDRVNVLKLPGHTTIVPPWFNEQLNLAYTFHSSVSLCMHRTMIQCRTMEKRDSRTIQRFQCFNPNGELLTEVSSTAFPAPFWSTLHFALAILKSDDAWMTDKYQCFLDCLETVLFESFTKHQYYDVNVVTVIIKSYMFFQ
jgi:hypothetical protein